MGGEASLSAHSSLLGAVAEGIEGVIGEGGQRADNTVRAYTRSVYCHTSREPVGYVNITILDGDVAVSSFWHWVTLNYDLFTSTPRYDITIHRSPPSWLNFLITTPIFIGYHDDGTNFTADSEAVQAFSCGVMCGNMRQIRYSAHVADWRRREMSCQTFEDLRAQIKGITGVTYSAFANHILKVSPDSYQRWTEQDKMINAHTSDNFTGLLEKPFQEFAKVVSDAQGKDNRIKTVSEWEWAQIREHYNTWKAHSHTSPVNPRVEIPHFSTISAVVKLLQWQDGQSARYPLNTKSIRRGRSCKVVRVNDESLVYRYAAIAKPTEATVRVRMFTSGDLEPIFLVPGQLMSSDGRTTDKFTRIQFNLAKYDKQILYGARVCNGYQSGNENVFVKVIPNATADHLSLIVDFTSVINESPFTEDPGAFYEDADENIKRITCNSYSDGKVWHVEYHNPEPGSRIGLYWSMIK